MPLTDLKCRAAKPGVKPQKLSDAESLYLLVQPNGSKLWRMDYAFEGKRKTLSFGKYPNVSLSAAREKRSAAKEAIAAGRDPALPSLSSVSPTFQVIAEEWLRVFASSWTVGSRSRIESRLRADLFPQIGQTSITEIDAPLLLNTLRKIEDRGALEIAKRMRQTSGQIFRYAIATGRASRDPSADLRGALRPSLRVRHMAALKETELPEFFAKLRAYDGDEKTRLTIELVAHTFVRTNEILGATWSEFEGDLWRIPAERMKMSREHLVPLTERSLAILARLRELDDDASVAKMSSNTMIYALYRMGYHSRATVHGFRSTASTILNESGLWSPDAIERQLAHVPSGVRAAYNAALYLPERRRMMEWWSKRLMLHAASSS